MYFERAIRNYISNKSNTGVFTTTYTAKGCEGDDVIKASTGALKVEGTVNVTPANLGAVEFVSAEPQNILLKGMSAAGLQHTSTVKFQIKNDVGGPIANADVKFELLTSAAGDGGIKLSTTTGKTDNNGFVSTILQAGSVHTTVRVKATVERSGITISSESSQLVVSTGIADQNSLSMSLSNHNPAAWNHDGVEVDVNIIASDRYNSPVPNGTAVAFYTELGQISPSFCYTNNGRCSVKWISSNPRDRAINDINYKHDGVNTITAKVIGEESFTDLDSNGYFNEGDIFEKTYTKNGETVNLEKGEVFEDYNNDQKRNNFEPYIDFDGNGQYTAADEKYTGIGCKHPSDCNTKNYLKDIFVSASLAMSEDNQKIAVYEDKNDDGKLTENEEVGELHLNKRYFINVFGVENKGVPPRDTTIAVSSEEVDIAYGASTQVENIVHSPFLATFSLKEKEEDGKPFGFVKIIVGVPGKSPAEFQKPYKK